jgi:hypothetical protein
MFPRLSWIGRFPHLSRGDRSSPDRHLSRCRGGVLSRVLPLRPLGHQAARYGAHLSPLLRALWHSPGLHHFPGYLPYICHSLWFLPQALLFLFLCHVCALLVSYFVLTLWLFIKTLTTWTCILTLSAHRYIDPVYTVYSMYSCMAPTCDIRVKMSKWFETKI